MDLHGTFQKKFAAKSNAERVADDSKHKFDNNTKPKTQLQQSWSECLTRVFTDEAKTRHYPSNARVLHTF